MSLSVLRISRPHSDARLLCRFVHQLTVRSGVTVGARRSASVRGQWQIVWYDGPTVIAMRRYAADLGRAVVGDDQRAAEPFAVEQNEVPGPIRRAGKDFMSGPGRRAARNLQPVRL